VQDSHRCSPATISRRSRERRLDLPIAVPVITIATLAAAPLTDVLSERRSAAPRLFEP
jgi:hypothetical protein